MKKNVFFSAVLALSLATPALADDGKDEKDEKSKTDFVTVDDFQVYGSVSLSLSQFSVSQGNATAVSDMTLDTHARVGAKFAKYIGVEAEYGLGLSDWDLDNTVSLGLDNQKAAYLVGRYPLSGARERDKGDVFIRLGYHSSDFEATAGSQSETISDEGFAFGIGGTYFFDNNIGARFDITSYHLDDDILGNIGSLTYIHGGLGLVARF